MKRCVLVVEATPRAIECGAFSAGGLEPIEYFSYAPENFAQAALKLAGDLGSRGLRPVRTLLSIHSSILSMRILDIPVRDRRKLLEIIELQADGLFAGGSGAAALDAVALPGGRAVVVGVGKQELSAELKALSDAGLGASWAGPAILFKDRVLKRVMHGEAAAALIDDDSLTVVRDGEACFFKHLGSVEDLELSLAALDSGGVKIEKFYSTASSFAREAGIEATELPAGFEHGSLLAVAMRYREGLSGGVDFLERHGDPRSESAVGFRRNIAVSLLAALVIFWGLFAYLRHQNISGEMRRAELAMESGFKDLFPGEAPKDPGYALEVRLAGLAKEKEVLSGASRPLEAMAEFSKASSGKGVRILETSVAGPKISVVGEAGSFDEAASFRTSLAGSPLMRDVTITDTRPARAGRVRFALKASLEAR